MIEVIRPDWPCDSRIRALCTTRHGGFSSGAYEGLNLARHVGDDSQSVNSNRQLLQQQLNLPGNPCWLNQTHSTDVTILSSSQSYEMNSDAAICRQPGQIAIVMTADCLPVLLCNRDGSEIAAVHAGWRGLVDGIIENTLKKLNSDPTQLLAWVGPAISQSRFEVGQEVLDLFIEKNKQAACHFKANRPGHWLCDLPGLAQDQLRQLGLDAIYLSGLCSFNEESRFYSFRRNKVTGRMASLIWINSDA